MCPRTSAIESKSMMINYIYFLVLWNSGFTYTVFARWINNSRRPPSSTCWWGKPYRWIITLHCFRWTWWVWGLYCLQFKPSLPYITCEQLVLGSWNCSTIGWSLGPNSFPSLGLFELHECISVLLHCEAPLVHFMQMHLCFHSFSPFSIEFRSIWLKRKYLKFNAL